MNAVPQQVRPEPLLFDFSDLLTYLIEVAEYKRDVRGLSYRALARLWGMKSPNYIQLLTSRKRKISLETAERIAAGLQFGRHERKYFLCLAKLELAQGDKERLTLREQMAGIANLALSKRREDRKFFDNWLNQVIFELACLPDQIVEVAAIHRLLEEWASPEEIAESINFLTLRGYLLPLPEQPGRYRQGEVVPEPLNEQRNLAIRNSHRRFLTMAQQRLSSSSQEREYQGLTIAIDEQRFPEVKKHLRAFMRKLNEELAEDCAATTVVRIECAMFKVIRER